ncbi:AI-2E family transporter [Ureibacillus sp. 179-F W5.1 NHS]|uniref:AI-2E family transporter n=1 Tax=Lysinibacillus halotolerans TaxID=1368476 RepID=A0A3M8HDG6_9BACI|nr:AI-2E family transporter [Lysinibacillus halotolerans]RND00508.1 AI-2E family transporter [Lysinibacillus halotolerans]
MQTNKINTFPFKNNIKYLVLIVYFILLWLILPVSLAIFFGYFLYPVINFCHKRLKIPYILSAILISILIFMATYSFFYITVQSIISIYPELKVQVENLDILNSGNHIMLETIFNKSLSYIDTAIMGLANILQDILSYIIELFIFLVAFFFSIFESKKNRLWFFIYVPKQYREEWKNYFKKATSLFGYFIYVEFQLFVITFILLSCGLALLQFENPINKSFLISLADALPFFGIGLFLIPIAIYFFSIGEKYLCFALIILYIFIQITRQIAESLLWASTFHLRTVHTFFISAASILLFGFYGILLSPFLLLIAVKYKQKSIYE